VTVADALLRFDSVPAAETAVFAAGVVVVAVNYMIVVVVVWAWTGYA